MEATAFWNIIGEYNDNTIVCQFVLLAVLTAGIFASYFSRHKWIAKAALGMLNLYIAIFFFLQYGTEPIQHYFALPLFTTTAILFFHEAITKPHDPISPPNKMAIALIILYASYPFVSMLLGERFPKIVTYIMPCPITTISIAIYSCYKKKNILLLATLTIWGLTGVKALFFNVYEDLILLIAGIYCLRQCIIRNS